ncbi:histone methyltransferase SET2 ASCRUDRAFT_78768 [Ascoidea rubescens DSM 1968]|uniref:Histone-lysine N-methyltransferase, H3 lysine-36 specific n=1 Tax=Ascoidea rubescens DSM 1968 TaxID=1344418 RepID=A0A1D2VQ60_9ASCO|nr:hypothetical protein ASCRUDRAFT_78768 [Ascoidea rubescens DSM 1968]ODV63736.1 hypothetical protein ASCRUDRAFT_78768 [Ascoidea rubescens DSM 1968]
MAKRLTRKPTTQLPPSTKDRYSSKEILSDTIDHNIKLSFNNTANNNHLSATPNPSINNNISFARFKILRLKSELTDLLSNNANLNDKTNDYLHETVHTENGLDKTDEALKTFTLLQQCTYKNTSLGLSGQDDMSCDCDAHDTADNVLPCGEDSDCINRLTSIECSSNCLRCGPQCANQRFQRKQYSDISIFQTEKKGFGVRANGNINPNTFIYEYIGEVIDLNTFKKKMLDYDRRNFRHFYFMMLQKNQFIDATIKGGLGRFVNHSCNPNAYVDKWVVGSKLRMGIFSKRKIYKGEEITFDYNVDRYGANPQPCYCNEPNCSGFIGGKTQTDAMSLLPQNIVEALNISNDDQREWYKDNKHLIKEGENIYNNFLNSIEIKPLNNKESVPKIISGLIQSQNEIITLKLLERLYNTEKQEIDYTIIRLHGYKTLGSILKKESDTISELILKIFLKWPRITKNKIVSSNVEEIVKSVIEHTKDKNIKELGSKLLKDWDNLEIAFRIQKKENDSNYNDTIKNYRQKFKDDYTMHDGLRLPENWEWGIKKENGSIYFKNSITGEESTTRPDINKYNEFVATRRKEEELKKRGVSDLKLKTIQKEKRFKKSEFEKQKFFEKQVRLFQLEQYQKDLKLKAKEKEEKEKIEKVFQEAKENELLRIKQQKEEQDQKERELKEIERQRSKLRALQARTKSSLNSENQNGNHKGHRSHNSKRHISKTNGYEQRSGSNSRRNTPNQENLSGGGTSSLLSSLNNNNSSRKKNPLEYKWKSLFAKYVPNMIKKHEKVIGHANLKNCAKDIVEILVDKELKRHSDDDVVHELSSGKREKVKVFVEGYMNKFLKKYDEKHSAKSHQKTNGANKINGNKTYNIRQTALMESITADNTPHNGHGILTDPGQNGSHKRKRSEIGEGSVKRFSS